MMFKKHAAIIAAISLIGGGAAWAQSTLLGPSMTAVTVGLAGSMNTLAANPTRKALTICNGHASQTATFTMGTLSPTSLTTGIVLAAGNVATSCFTVVNPAPGTSGAGVGAQVNVVASGASTPVTFIEYY